MRHAVRSAPVRRVTFCDNSFNVPRRHAEALCQAFISEALDISWSTSDLKPVGVTDRFCALLAESGCVYANLAVESASAPMLERLGRGYSVRQVREALDALSWSRLAFGASLMLGGPGETPETSAASLRVLDDYEIRQGVWVTIGV